MEKSTLTREREGDISHWERESSVSSSRPRERLSIIRSPGFTKYNDEKSSDIRPSGFIEYNNQKFLANQGLKLEGDSFTVLNNQILVSVNDDVIIRTLPVKQQKKPDKFFKVHQKWQGTVIELDGEKITAHIYDLLAIDPPRDEITFDFMEIPEGDRNLVVVGAVFYWFIGYEDSRLGRRRVSKIRFQRRLGWTANDLERQRKRSRNLIEYLTPEELAKWNELFKR